MNIPTRECWFLTGATAVGKTRVGLELAHQLDAEIISLDSMSIYRGMDIGTAKPSTAQQALAVHHLIDIVDPEDEFSVVQYLETAGRAVAEITGRGKQVLFVGGTPLYLKSLLRGLYGGPPANWKLREEIAAEVAEIGQEALHARLEMVDPVAASQIHPNDTRRLIRALEVFRATGEPLSHKQLQFEEGLEAEQCRVFVLRRERAEQHERIEARVDAMLESGLVEEVRSLTADGNKLGRTARQAVGYREAIDFLDGAATMAGVADRMKARTRRFAKRQGTWFRSLSECRFLDIAGVEDAPELAAQIISAGGTIESIGE